ncbi:calcium calmodulin-dependent kinase [Fusarium albosuccineum]|uniref:Calcium calmodulin-dependent kinase n=1 Tax=Fusarium albosuccineum TaxID=1237068 RepID=A0A8H4LCN4_9HYPO|nr:calcium calmodulin-dependent kinase [Fusarium albosuccineum]
MSNYTSGPDAELIFSIWPTNPAAQELLDELARSLDNDSFSDEEPRFEYIDIQFDPGCQWGLIHSIVSEDDEVTLDDDGYEDLMFSFKIHIETGEIVLMNESEAQPCKFYGDSRVPVLSDSQLEGMVIDPDINLEFGVGGRRATKYRWRIEWHEDSLPDLAKWVDTWGDRRLGHDGVVMDIPPQPCTRNKQAMERYLTRTNLSFTYENSVSKAVDVYSGQCVAIKSILRPDNAIPIEATDFAKLSHSNIMEIFQVIIRPSDVGMVMPLADGDLEALVETDEDFFFVDGLMEPGDEIGLPILRQMAQALDYLDYKGIIHHDVKPGNILYHWTGDAYHYRLADFGISTFVDDEPSFLGTRPYKAPEVMFEDLEVQNEHTPKLDIWSLCATIVDVFRIDKFQYSKCYEDWDIMRAVIHDAKMVGGIVEKMAHTNPHKRVSAADILDEVFGGVGRTTPY